MRFSVVLITVCTFGIAGCSGCNNDRPTGDAHAHDAKEERNVNIDPKLEQFVSQARSDLARRLAIDASEITLIEAGFVTWPNSALGCPEPDMMYTQALVPGYRIRFRAEGASHHYHGATGKPPKHCPADRVTEPASGSAGPDDAA